MDYLRLSIFNLLVVLTVEHSPKYMLSKKATKKSKLRSQRTKSHIFILKILIQGLYQELAVDMILVCFAVQCFSFLMVNEMRGVKWLSDG